VPIILDDLTPYKSLLVLSAQGLKDRTTLVDDVISDVEATLKIGLPHATRTLEHRIPATKVGTLEVGVLHYREQRQAAWTGDPAVVDVRNHLVLVCRLDGYVAVHLSDTTRRGGVVAELGDPTATTGLGALVQVPPKVLNAAFVDGEARTLWLSGTHRSTPTKVDNKIISGVDLRLALDPAGDQTFYFSAARCKPAGLGVAGAIGVAPQKAGLWIGVTKEWKEFVATIGKVLKHLAKKRSPSDSPLPVLATDDVDKSSIRDAFDVALQPPEYLEDPTADATEQQEAEEYATHTVIEVRSAAGLKFTADVRYRGKHVGSADFEVKLDALPRVSVAVANAKAAAGTAGPLSDILNRCTRRGWLKVWFDSGHTVAGGRIFKVHYRDLPFDGFHWVDFGTHEIDVEKPDDLEEIGKHKSLFCWTRKTWPVLSAAAGIKPGGWLACDDGSGEIADFIHLDDRTKGEPPLLTLIHVKGANSSKKGREVSVSAYEIVVGQAVKNLRFLDQVHLHKGLVDGKDKKIAAAVWHEGKKSDRQTLLTRLKGFGAEYRRRVVVIQPHVSKSLRDAATLKPKGANASRMRQLNSLLLGARSSCGGHGADFAVVGSMI
jgi:hypothetical protein